jgi:hypothetical protein
VQIEEEKSIGLDSRINLKCNEIRNNKSLVRTKKEDQQLKYRAV